MPRQCLSKNIVITPTRGRVTVTFDGRVIADTTRALDLDEPGAPLRVYIPREDVSVDVLTESGTHTTCPYKGEASYHSLKSANAAARDAVLSRPLPARRADPRLSRLLGQPDPLPNRSCVNISQGGHVPRLIAILLPKR